MIYVILLILGAIQGATEFLPVSSSGHLALSRLIMNQSDTLALMLETPLMLDILLHVATLAAVALFFRKRIADAFAGSWRLVKSVSTGAARQRLATDDGANLAVCVVIGTLPTGIMGVIFKDFTETVGSTPWMLGATFFFCSALLFASKFWPGGAKRLSIGSALIIGIAQGIAVFPGISRSGTTIAVALALGLRREEAATFSFLLSLPAILGAALLEIDVNALLLDGPIGAYLLGTASAFLIGLVALYSLVALVKTGRLWLFAPYLVVVGFYCLSVG